MSKYIVALDQGTTSSRTIVFNKKGEIVSKAQYEFPQIYPKAGWVEHDPMEILKSQMRSLADALIDGAIQARDIVGIGVTNQRETTILWDKTTGQPVYHAIVWQCRRTAEACEELKKDAELCAYIQEHTGLVVDAYFSATKIKWILDNCEKAREVLAAGNLLFGTVETWLIWNLSGGKVHVTDYSNASRTMLFDVDKLCWDEYLCRKLGVPMSILPTPVASSGIYGVVSSHGIPGLESLSGIPICGAIGDQPSALFGQGCFEAGQAKNTYGTGCFLLMTTGEKRVRSENNLLTGAAWGLDGRVVYDVEGSAFNAGSTIQWLRDELHLIESAPECDRLAESVPDAGGIYLVPAFTGLGAPYWDMYARGCIVGITRGTNRAHFARAVLEGIVYQMTDLLRAMQADSSVPLKELRVDGGASVSNIMMQIQADMTGCPVNRPKVVETTALGAAYMAGLAVGFWSGLDEIAKIRTVDKIFFPAITDDERETRYRAWQRAVDRARNWAALD